MTLKLSSVKAGLWFGAVVLIALSFPLQVYAGNPNPSLLPYVLILGAFFLDWVYPTRISATEAPATGSRGVDAGVTLYVALVLFDTAWQVGVGATSPYEGASGLVNFLLPALCYLYFRKPRLDSEIRAVLTAIAVAGFVVGAYFAYDSYVKLALGQVGDYARRAFQYSLARANLTAAEANDARARIGFRSFGLLESHSVSGAWVILGAFGALALTPRYRQMRRRLIVFAFATMLMVGLNFTTIVAFTAIMLLFEFGGLQVVRGRVSGKLAANVAWLVILVSVMVTGAFWVVGDVMARFIISNFAGQTDLALGTRGAELTMLDITIRAIGAYGRHLQEAPFTALVGDGFASYGMNKGGDIGWIESTARLGIPMALVAVVGLTGLSLRALRHMRVAEPATAAPSASQLLEFSVCVTLMVFVTEIHYTVWTTKAVLPIVFLALAFYRQYLPDRRA